MLVMDNVENIVNEAHSAISGAHDMHDLMHNIKPRLLGNGSSIDKMSKTIKLVSNDEKKEIGMRVNYIRSTIESLIKERVIKFEEVSMLKILKSESIDSTLPGRSRVYGKIHPISIVINELISIFSKYGFDLNFGPEMESEFYNFTALNMPHDHPAKQMHDTFYLKEKESLLRTHTTSVDIRALMLMGGPLYSISCGKTFRYDSDRTHSPMFHQFDMVAVDTNLTMSNLKWYIYAFLQEFFDVEDVVIRMRPSFFPFTEPSAEIDIGYKIDDSGKFLIDDSPNDFLEIMGCGMLHPNVLQLCNVDPDKFKGIAFGVGIERIAMLKYGIRDLREFFVGNYKWIQSYGVSGFKCN